MVRYRTFFTRLLPWAYENPRMPKQIDLAHWRDALPRVLRRIVCRAGQTGQQRCHPNEAAGNLPCATGIELCRDPACAGKDSKQRPADRQQHAAFASTFAGKRQRRGGRRQGPTGSGGATILESPAQSSEKTTGDAGSDVREITWPQRERSRPERAQALSRAGAATSASPRGPGAASTARSTLQSCAG